MAKSVKLNFLYNILLNISKVIFPLITAPYVSRVLEPDGVGLFNFTSTYAAYFALFAALGIPMYGIRETAKVCGNKEKENQLLSELLSIEAIITAVCAIVYIATVMLIPQLNTNYILFLIAGVSLYITPFKVEWFFSGREEFGYITARSIIIKTLSVVALFVFVHTKDDLFIYVILGTLSTIANEVWNYWRLLKLGYRPKPVLEINKHIKPLLILFASSIAVSIYTMLDNLMLGFFSDYSEVGYYNSANHIAKTLMPVVTSLAAVAMPRLSNYSQPGDWQQINSLLDKSVSIVAFLALPITAGVILAAPVFVPLFFGPLYENAILPLQILALVITIIGFNNITTIQILAGLSYDKPYLYSVLVGTISNFCLNMLLIPIWGASGAALSSVTAEFLILVISGIYVFRKTPIRIKNKKDILKTFVAVSMFVPVCLLLKSYTDGWIYVFLSVSSCGLLYITAQTLMKNTSMLTFNRIIRKK